MEIAVAIDKRVVGFIRGFQQNLNQIYRNQKVVGDMAYTNNVHATVLREIMFDKGIITKEEYSDCIEKELEARDAIQKKQAQEAEERAEELRKKQAEQAAASLAAELPAPSSEEPVEPVIFGGNLGTEEADGEVAQGEQGHVEDPVPTLQE